LPTCLSSTSSSSLNPQPSLSNLKTSSPKHPVHPRSARQTFASLLFISAL
jgi:hypothetical protein